MQHYGLIGYPLVHSFSQRFFSEKFARAGIAGARYDLFPLPDLAQFPKLLQANPDLRGLNVTIPHKETVVRYLHDLDETARAVGAVNTIRIRNGRLTGFNTDTIGFRLSLLSWLTEQGLAVADVRRALVLGTGGAAKAVGFVLEKLAVDVVWVSRAPKRAGVARSRPDTFRQTPSPAVVSYDDLQDFSADDFTLLINATPVGTYPMVDTCPPISFAALDERHLVYDLVYNPAETLLLRRAKARGAAVKNGLEMLQLQAEAAWEIWQEQP